jgi:hypothetical protein
MNRISPLVAFLATCSLVSALLLLLSNVQLASPQIRPVVHAALGSVPLALIGIAYALMQIRLKPDRVTLAKRLLLAGTFILWAVDQCLPPGRVATVVGDFVVSAYVVDLYWIIQEQRNL